MPISGGKLQACKRACDARPTPLEAACPILGPQQHSNSSALARSRRPPSPFSRAPLHAGTGKTVVFSSLIRYVCEQHALNSAARSTGSESGGETDGGAPAGAGGGAPRVLILAHRRELIAQAEETLGLVWPGARVTIVQQETKDFSGQVRGG